jgi:hypothetical protein
MWQSFGWRSAEQIRHIRTFAEVHGLRHRKLEPQTELVVPNKTGPSFGYFGWTYCARTPDRALFMLYFEKDAPLEATLRGVSKAAQYRPAFFDPRVGEWLEAGEPIKVAPSSVLMLPPRPDGRDWGLMLERLD